MSGAFETHAGGLVRVYRSVTPGPGLVWAHGGGFTGGDIDMPEADWVSAELATRGLTVVSVDYRRALPGAGYPIPSDDVLAAWDWAVAHADELGVQDGRLHLGGASAGGNLAAGAVLRLLEGGGTLPAGVILVYPTLLAVQPRPGEELRAALDADRDADIFGPDVVRTMYEAYLDGPVGGASAAAIPGLATREQLTGFPPTLVLDADVDELRLSGEDFVASLQEASRRVELWTEIGTVHGFLNHPGLPAGVRALDLIAGWIDGERTVAASHRSSASETP